jgi:tetratricopeptide (TPR) repeat protein
MHTNQGTRWSAIRRNALIVCLLLDPFSIRCQSSPSGPTQATIQEMQSGAAAMHQGKPAEAEAFFRQATEAQPALPDAYLGLGMAQLRQGKADQAQVALAKAIELNPNLRGAHMFLGIAQYQANQLDAAEASLKQEVTSQPTNVEALTWLGIVELGAGHAEEAVGPLDQAAALNPKDPNVLDYRGRAHALVAQESYRALTALDPDSWRVHRALGEIASESQQWQSAVAEYQKAIEKLATNPDLYESLGEAYQHLSQLDDATHAYEEELKLSPHNAIALYNLGRIQVLSGDPARGVAYLRQAMEQNLKSAPATYYLGLGLAQTGHPEEAVSWLEKSLEQSPSDFIKQGIYAQLAREYQALHRPEEAQRAAEELKRLKASASRTSGPAEAP